MHIPDGILDAKTAVATGALAVAGVGTALWQAKRTLPARRVPLLGVTAAFIFAAQMLNFPIAGGTSGHFLGALLAAVLLGPLNACLILTVVLFIQCLGFADGGLTALGSNVFNMGIIGGLVAYYVFRALQFLLPKSRGGFLAAVALSAWLSVVLAAVSCACELSFSGTLPLRVALPTMGGVYALIGVGEALVTTVIISTVLGLRPDLVGAWKPVGTTQAQGV